MLLNNYAVQLEITESCKDISSVIFNGNDIWIQLNRYMYYHIRKEVPYMGYIEAQSVDLDFRNSAYLKSYIAAHKDDEFALSGKNEDGELVMVAAVADNVNVAVFQSNGCVMHHTYWLSGEVEEWFES